MQSLKIYFRREYKSGKSGFGRRALEGALRRFVIFTTNVTVVLKANVARWQRFCWLRADIVIQRPELSAFRALGPGAPSKPPRRTPLQGRGARLALLCLTAAQLGYRAGRYVRTSQCHTHYSTLHHVTWPYVTWPSITRTTEHRDTSRYVTLRTLWHITLKYDRLRYAN